MRTPTRAAALALALLGARCTEWIPASAPGAAGERYVRVHLDSETTTLHAPSRDTLRELESEGARLQVRRLDPVQTALAAVAITVGAAVMTALVVYAATRPAIAWSNIP